MENLRVRCTFTEGILGTCSANTELHTKYIASKAEDAKKIEEEVAALGAEEVEREQMTIFPRNDDGQPFLWDYQIRGFFKGACSFLNKVKTTKSSTIKAFKKKIDGHVFIAERQIPIVTDKEIISCQRPLRASTPMGERVALSNSEEVQAGATIEFTVECLIDDDINLVREWLNYGKFNGIGQWRNSGKGRFYWEELDSDGNVIGGNYKEFRETA